jgi:linear primary-alkylsulfatase
VVAVVHSHSHADHFGGVRGVVEEADMRSGKVSVIAPVGFMDNAVSENVYAGNAMNRRLFYQYGVLLPRDPLGHVDQAIGKNTAVDNLGLIPPNVIIEKYTEELTVDGVKMVFQNTPGTEAPAKLAGNREVYEQLKTVLVNFTPDFEMMPGTKPAKPAESEMNPFEQEALGRSDGG